MIDQFHDRSFKQLYGLLKEYPHVDGLVKTANIDVDEQEKRSNHAFAWPERRLFPIDSPEQATLSRLYMEKQAGVPEDVLKRCDSALELYGVQLDLNQTKVASSPEQKVYLLPGEKRYQITGPETVKLASDAILRDSKNLSAENKATAAINLVKQASVHKVSVPVAIHKMAGETVCHTPTLRDWLEARAEATDNPAVKKAYTKLAGVAAQKEEYDSDRNDLIKVADVIYELDEASGLNAHYDKRLPDPMQTVFNTDKIAEEMVDMGGREVPLSKLLAVSPEAYEDAFGDDLAGEFTDDGQIDPEQLKIILQTVPLDLQQALMAQMGF